MVVVVGKGREGSRVESSRLGDDDVDDGWRRRGSGIGGFVEPIMLVFFGRGREVKDGSRCCYWAGDGAVAETRFRPTYPIESLRFDAGFHRSLAYLAGSLRCPWKSVRLSVSVSVYVCICKSIRSRFFVDTRKRRQPCGSCGLLCILTPLPRSLIPWGMFRLVSSRSKQSHYLGLNNLWKSHALLIWSIEIILHSAAKGTLVDELPQPCFDAVTAHVRRSTRGATVMFRCPTRVPMWSLLWW